MIFLLAFIFSFLNLFSASSPDFEFKNTVFLDGKPYAVRLKKKAANNLFGLDVYEVLELERNLKMYVPKPLWLKQFGMKVWKEFVENELYFSKVLKDLGFLIEDTFGGEVPIINSDEKLPFYLRKSIDNVYKFDQNPDNKKRFFFHKNIPDVYYADRPHVESLLWQSLPKEHAILYRKRHTRLVISEILLLCLHGIYTGRHPVPIIPSFFEAEEENLIFPDLTVTDGEWHVDFKDAMNYPYSLVLGNFKMSKIMEPKKALDCYLNKCTIENVFAVMRRHTPRFMSYYYDEIISYFVEETERRTRTWGEPHILKNILEELLNKENQGKDLTTEDIITNYIFIHL